MGRCRLSQFADSPFTRGSCTYIEAAGALRLKNLMLMMSHSFRAVCAARKTRSDVRTAAAL